MYDKIELRIRDAKIMKHFETNGFSIFKRNPSFIRVGNATDRKYRLINRKEGDNLHYLTVQIVQKVYGEQISSPELYISGSLRKWHLGALSLRDMTRFDTLQVLKCLAQELEIPYADFVRLRLSSVEVGLNLDMGKVKPFEVLSRMRHFKNSRYMPAMYDENYVRFKTSYFTAKAYDKIEEIKHRKTSREKKKNWGDLYKERNILRLEFTVRGGASKTNAFFRITTLEDLVTHYNWVAAAWSKYCRSFRFEGKNILPFTPKERSLKEFSDYLLQRGLMDLMVHNEFPKILTGFSSQAKKDVSKKTRKLIEQMPEVIHIRRVFRQTVRRHFVDLLRTSQPEWVAKSM